MFAVIGQGCCMAILAGTVWDGGHAAGLVATVMLFLFNFFFGVGLLAIPWLCMFFLSNPFSLGPHKCNYNTDVFHSACGVCTPRNPNSCRCLGDCNQL